MPKIFYNLQAMRFIAAMAVAVFHIEIYYRRAGGAWSLDPFKVGYARIDLFFVISGFVTTHVAGKMKESGEAARFIFRRFARIFTAYWPAMMLMLAIVAVFAPSRLAQYEYMEGVLLIHVHKQRILPPSWTLSLELIFYVVFAAACLLPRKLLPWAAALFIAVIVTNHFLPAEYRRPTLLSPLILEFMLGAGVRLALNYVRLRGGYVLVGIGVVGLFAAAYLRREIGGSVLTRALLVGSAAAFLVYAAASLEMSGRRFATRLAPLGDYSYAIYLIHWPILALAGYTVQGWVKANPWSAEIVYGSLLPIILGAAILYHRYVEFPLFRLATAWMKKGPSPRPQLVPAPT